MLLWVHGRRVSAGEDDGKVVDVEPVVVLSEVALDVNTTTGFGELLWLFRSSIWLERDAATNLQCRSFR